MEDIYDDLDNYEDVNALEELRKENQELKKKLEEYSADIAKLQKDHDNLEMEFNILQNNYSSLLKTARAEVQRKTDMINLLNQEKDSLVLTAFKNGKIINRHFNRPVKNSGRNNYEKSLGKEEKNTQKCDKPLYGKTDMDIINSDTNKRKKSEMDVVKEELSKNRKAEKSNVNKTMAQHKTDPKTSASNIKDRRKSMPAVSMPINTFSSDDELERNFKTKDTRTDHLQVDYERRNINKIPINRYSTETSSVEDRGHNYHDSSRDFYKGRQSKHHINSLHRGRDKYEVSLKYRKQYSPERGQKRHHREYQDDYLRHEHGRYQGRSLESPPPESYDRRQRRIPDLRSDDRYSRDYGRNRHHQDDKYSAKYRSTDHDEPDTKRQRTESYGYHESYPKEDWKHYHNRRESIDVQPAPTFSPHECDMLRFSCQSPDSEHMDAASHPDVDNPTKEIRGTAIMPLEDPRVTSDKYEICKENGKEKITSVISRKINIRPVNKVKWNIKPVNCPAALTHRPSECSDQLVQDIYRDINNPVTNLDTSMESGEVHEPDDKISSHPKGMQLDVQDFKITQPVPEHCSKHVINAEIVSKPNITNYRIPKVGQNNNNTHTKIDVPIIDLDENVSHNKKINKKGAVGDSCPKELSTHKQQYKKGDDFLSNNKNDSKIESNKAMSVSQNKNMNKKGAIEDSVPKEIISQKQQYKHSDDFISSNKNESKMEGTKDEHVRHHKNINKKSAVEDSVPKEIISHKQQYKHRDDILSSNKIDSKMEGTKNENVRQHHRNINKKGAVEDSAPKELLVHKQQYKHSDDFHFNSNSKIEGNKNENVLHHKNINKKGAVEDSVPKEILSHKQQYKHSDDFLSNNKKDNKMESTKNDHVTHQKNINKKGTVEDSVQKELLTHTQQYKHSDDLLSNSQNNSKIEGNKERRESENQAMLTKIAIVADDLELSDDNSDHIDTNKKVVLGTLQKNCEAALNNNEARTDDSISNGEKTNSSHNTEIERMVDTAEMKDVAEQEKTKELDTKKQKHKKKKSKSKEISKNSVESTSDVIHVPVKKPGSKKEKKSKPKETKEKFSDLFGDSSSLMTPEDLGIPSYLPISEDAQDAVDMKINQIIDATPQFNKDEIPSDIQNQNSVEITIPERTHEMVPKNVLLKSNTGNKEEKDIAKEIAMTQDLPTPIVFENLNPKTDSNDHNVVKTVIISTGVQPEIAYENNSEVRKPTSSNDFNTQVNSADVHLFPGTKEFRRDALKALATSTPQKEFTAANPLEPDAAKTDVICDPDVGKAVETINDTEQVLKPTEKDTLESNDAPDVRIFVKRRRKVVKRPPMT